jgi:hypothetical protein
MFIIFDIAISSSYLSFTFSLYISFIHLLQTVEGVAVGVPALLALVSQARTSPQ